MATYRVATMGIPLPPAATGSQGPKLPGGLPPRAKTGSTVFLGFAHAKGGRDRLRGFFDARKAA